MPIYEPSHIEYAITSGHIQVVAENGTTLPAYWAHPNSGRMFPSVALIHDWWGITPVIRRIAHLFAQSGYYVIVPDLFEGHLARTPEEAMELVKKLGDRGYPRIDAALSVLEKHHYSNQDVAAVGIGMGGSLAYEAAIVRKDLEAAVSFFGFPQRYLGKFQQATTPILAIYGDQEPYIPATKIIQLREELAASSLGEEHQMMILQNVGREFLSENATEAQQELGRQALNATFSFLEKYLQGPTHKPRKTI
jgi:carboxymethylenebutenolidase